MAEIELCHGPNEPTDRHDIAKLAQGLSAMLQPGTNGAVHVFIRDAKDTVSRRRHEGRGLLITSQLRGRGFGRVSLCPKPLGSPAETHFALLSPPAALYQLD